MYLYFLVRFEWQPLSDKNPSHGNLETAIWINPFNLTIKYYKNH